MHTYTSTYICISTSIFIHTYNYYTSHSMILTSHSKFHTVLIGQVPNLQVSLDNKNNFSLKFNNNYNNWCRY